MSAFKHKQIKNSFQKHLHDVSIEFASNFTIGLLFIGSQYNNYQTIIIKHTGTYRVTNYCETILHVENLIGKLQKAHTQIMWAFNYSHNAE